MKALAAITALGLWGCGPVGRPTADPGPLQRTARAGEELVFDGSASKGSISRYTWDFGDGTPPVENKVAPHTYAANGDYSATLTVRGPGGAHSASVLVNVGTGCAATADINVVTNSPQPNQTVVFGSTGSMGCNGAMLKRYEWEFGDGAASAGDSSKATVSHVYTDAGTYLVKLRVLDVDDNEGRASRSLGVGVMNTGKPLVTCQMSVTGEVNKPIQLVVNGSDPGGMTLTYAWTFSDSSTAMGSNVNKVFTSTGNFTATVVATTTDMRRSDPCTTQVTVTAPRNYTGNWLLSPNGSMFRGNCPFNVAFPASALQILHEANPDGGAALLTVTPTGGNYPIGYDLFGSEDPTMPGSFSVARVGPMENPNQVNCTLNLNTRHSIRLTFGSAQLVTGSWSKVYDGCIMPSCATCNCVAGGPTHGTFNGVKQ